MDTGKAKAAAPRGASIATSTATTSTSEPSERILQASTTSAPVRPQPPPQPVPTKKYGVLPFASESQNPRSFSTISHASKCMGLLTVQNFGFPCDFPTRIFFFINILMAHRNFIAENLTFSVWRFTSFRSSGSG